MDTQYLIDIASKLPPVSVEAALNYSSFKDSLAAEVSRILSQRQDLDLLIGSGNLAMMEDNHRNHARFISSLMTAFDPQVLVESILWVFRAYRSHGFQLTYWPAQLDAWLEAMKQQLTEKSYLEIEPLYNFMLFNLPLFGVLTDPPPSSPDL